MMLRNTLLFCIALFAGATTFAKPANELQDLITERLLNAPEDFLDNPYATHEYIEPKEEKIISAFLKKRPYSKNPQMFVEDIHTILGNANSSLNKLYNYLSYLRSEPEVNPVQVPELIGPDGWLRILKRDVLDRIPVRQIGLLPVDVQNDLYNLLVEDERPGGNFSFLEVIRQSFMRYENELHYYGGKYIVNLEVQDLFDPFDEFQEHLKSTHVFTDLTGDEEPGDPWFGIETTLRDIIDEGRTGGLGEATHHLVYEDLGPTRYEPGNHALLAEVLGKNGEVEEFYDQYAPKSGYSPAFFHSMSREFTTAAALIQNRSILFTPERAMNIFLDSGFSIKLSRYQNVLNSNLRQSGLKSFSLELKADEQFTREFINHLPKVRTRTVLGVLAEFEMIKLVKSPTRFKNYFFASQIDAFDLVPLQGLGLYFDVLYQTTGKLNQIQMRQLVAKALGIPKITSPEFQHFQTLFSDPGSRPQLIQKFLIVLKNSKGNELKSLVSGVQALVNTRSVSTDTNMFPGCDLILSQ